MIPGSDEFVGIRLVWLDLDDGTLHVELLLDDYSIASAWWPLDDIPAQAVAVASAELDRNEGFLRIAFVLRSGESELQHWDFWRLRQFMGVRGGAQDAPAGPMLQ